MNKFYPADEVFSLYASDVQSGYDGEYSDWLVHNEIRECMSCKKHFSIDEFWNPVKGYEATCDNCRTQANSPKWLIFPDCPHTFRMMDGKPVLELRASNARNALSLARRWGLYEQVGALLIAVEADKNLAEYEAALSAHGMTLDRERYPNAAALPANESPERFANIEWMLSRVRFETRRYGKQAYSWAHFEDPTGHLVIGAADPWPGLKWPAEDLRLAAHDALNDATKKVQCQEVAA